MICWGMLCRLSKSDAQTVQGRARSVDQWYTSAQAAEAKNDTGIAIHDYQELLKIAPGTAAAYNNLGTLYYDTGDFQRAIETLQAGLKINPRMASSHAVLGSAYLAVGNSKEAIEQLALAVKENPKDSRSEDVLEQTLIAAHEDDLAAERIRARLVRAPNDQDALYRLGKLHLRQSQELFDRVEKIDPDAPVAHELRGELQEDLGHFQEAQKQYELAVTAAPDKPGTHEHLGNILWLQALWEPAAKEFRAELQNDNSSCRAHWKLANCLLNQGADADQALSETNVAVAECSDLVPARVDRARALINLGKPADALPDLLLAVKQNPEEPTIHFLLAKVYSAAGKPAEADTERARFAALSKKDKPTPTQSEVGSHP